MHNVMSERNAIGRMSRALIARVKTLAARSYYQAGASMSQISAAAERTAGVDFLLVTVAFNQPDLIAKQASMIDRQFLDTCSLVVADNSSDEGARRTIEKICRDSGASYLPLPKNPSFYPSLSHGYALNYVYRTLVTMSEAPYVGFLDHDIFPITDLSYKECVSSHGVYGRIQDAGAAWYYWPGFFFFERGLFGDSSADFRPGRVPSGIGRSQVVGDTGSGNWRKFFSRMDLSSTPSCSKGFLSVNSSLRLPTLTSSASKQDEYFELLDGKWLHVVNGSNWAGVDMSAKLNSIELHFADDGLFNHELPRRGETFVTRKITRAAARIKAGLEANVYLHSPSGRASKEWICL